MSKEKESESAVPLQIQRKKFIIDELRSRGRVSLKSIQAEYEGIKYQTVYDDIDAISFLLGRNIERLHESDGMVFVDNTKKLIQSHETRKSVSKKEKRLISSLLTGLIFAQKRPNAAQVENEKYRGELPCSSIEEIQRAGDASVLTPSRELIESRLASQTNNDLLRRLKKKLHSMWDQSSVMIAMDSGTTASVFIEESLSQLGNVDRRLPLLGSTLTNLSIVTNNPENFMALGSPDLLDIRGVIVGGYHIHRGQAVGGYLTQKFLSSTELKFAMTIIGTTIIDIKHERIGSGSDRDISVKQDFLDRGEIRVVIADHTKFLDGAYKAATHFARISPDCIDLIVADRISEQNLKEINDMGVPVLSFETF